MKKDDGGGSRGRNRSDLRLGLFRRYTYDPFQHSPNDNPEAELPLNAGDYVLIWGEMDEVWMGKGGAKAVDE